jgi:hypothetical protein
MREGAMQNRYSVPPRPDDDGRTMEDENEGNALKAGYTCLSKAERGRPREEMSEPVPMDMGPWRSMQYPDS